MDREVYDFYGQNNQDGVMLSSLALEKHYQSCFNTDSYAEAQPYERMIKKYDQFFKEEQEVVSKKLGVLLNGRSIWEVLKVGIQSIENKQKYEYLHQVGYLSQEDHSEFVSFTKDVLVFFDSLIQVNADACKKYGHEPTIFISSSKEEKLQFAKHLLSQNELSE